jgi:hypothetical protein
MSHWHVACAHPCNFFAPKIGFVESLLGGLGDSLLSAGFAVSIFQKAALRQTERGESGKKKPGFSTESKLPVHWPEPNNSSVSRGASGDQA